MLLFVVERIAIAMVVVVCAVAGLFLMIQLVPGDPAAVMLGPRATPELRALLRETLHLNEPIYLQIYYFVAGLLHGDFGTDLATQRPVLDMILDRMPHTLALVLSSLLVSLIGIPIGVYAATHRNGLFDRISGLIAISTISIPALIVSLYLILVFAVRLQWLPAIGVGEGFWSSLKHLILPSFAIGLSWIGYIARLTRASMIEVLERNHIRMARAFGLTEWTVLRRYALRVALPPIITILGIGVGYVLSTAVVVEIVFARPGIGKMMYEAVISRNYPLVIGSVLFSTVFIVAATAIADIVNWILDPRSRMVSGK